TVGKSLNSIANPAIVLHNKLPWYDHRSRGNLRRNNHGRGLDNRRRHNHWRRLFLNNHRRRNYCRLLPIRSRKDSPAPTPSIGLDIASAPEVMTTTMPMSPASAPPVLSTTAAMPV